MIHFAIAGNPNCGKSALFNRLTGIRQTTGNWPGVTVDRKEGRFDLNGEEVAVIDLPGIYSLDASSLDEEVTRDYLLSREAQVIVNVLNAANLERNLYLTIQLLEMGVPMVVALNMMDVARKRGVEVDLDKLAEKLGCPVVPIVAVSGEGLDELKGAVRRVADGEQTGGVEMIHEDAVEQAITDLKPLLADRCKHNNCRWLALKLLEGDKLAESIAGDEAMSQVQALRDAIEERTGDEADIHIADTRYGLAHAMAGQVVKEKGEIGRTTTDRIDRIVLSRWLGIPLFLLVMYLMFMFTINIGGAFVDFFDIAAGALFVDGVAHLMASLGAPEWLNVFLANGIGAGIQTVATFIPIIAGLYLFLSFLEDSGYMARAAFVMDRAMRAIGLPGKAFVPMIVGFGCNVPAVMATRTLENPRERKLTILMNPFMSCGARLPVYALFAAAFFPTNGQNVVFSLYLIGIAVAIFTGMIMKRSLLAGESTGFVMELPPYHLPTLRGILLRTRDRLKMFIRDAGKVIVIMVMALNVLNAVGTDGSFGNEDSDKSVLSAMGRAVTPVFGPMGIEEENWPATVGVFTGVLAKEVVVGTLDSIYTNIAEQNGGGEEAPFDLTASLGEALATIPENLAGVGELLLDPLGVDIGDVSDQAAAAEAQAVSEGIFGTMAKRFDGQAGAYAYMLFILLYAPCVATIGAIVRETSGRWAIFVIFWTTGMAYMTASSFYQVATFSRHPASSTSWLLGVLVAFIAVVAWLRYWSRNDRAALKAASVRSES